MRSYCTYDITVAEGLRFSIVGQAVFSISYGRHNYRGSFSQNVSMVKRYYYAKWYYIRGQVRSKVEAPPTSLFTPKPLAAINFLIKSYRFMVDSNG